MLRQTVVDLIYREVIMRSYHILILLFLVLFLQSQEVAYTRYDPFITSYQHYSSNTQYVYDDLIVLVNDWGYAFLKNDNGELSEMSRIYIETHNSIARYGDKIYTSNSCNFNTINTIIIWEIDISDPYAPQINQILSINETPLNLSFHVIYDFLYVFLPFNDSYLKIDLRTSELIDEYSLDFNKVYQVGNSFVTENSTNTYNCYRHTDGELEAVYTNFDIEAEHLDPSIRNIGLLAPGLAGSISYYSIVLWDVEDFENWTVIDSWNIQNSSYFGNSGSMVLDEHDLYLSSYDEMIVLQLGGDYSIREVTQIPIEFYDSLAEFGIDEQLLILKTYAGLALYDISTNPEFQEFFQDNCYLYSHHIIDNDYFLLHGTIDYYQGVSHADISEPASPQLLPLIFEERYYTSMQGSGRFIKMDNIFDNYYDVYQWQNDEMQILEHQAYTQAATRNTLLRTDPNDPDTYYKINDHYYTIEKYHISDGVQELVMNENLPDIMCGFVRNGFAYCISDSEILQDIQTYSGLEQNNIVEENIYPGYAGGDYQIDPVNENYFQLYKFQTRYLVGYNDGELTGQVFLIPGENGLSGFVDNWLVSFNGREVYLNEIDENTNGCIQPDQVIKLVHRMYRIAPYENENGYYLFCQGYAAVSVVALEITANSLDWEIVETSDLVTAYPNPFSLKDNSIIKFDLKTPLTRNSVPYILKIYNLKGQLIAEDKILADQETMYWNAELLKKSHTPSGNYMYTLEAKGIMAKGKFIIVK